MMVVVIVMMMVMVVVVVAVEVVSKGIPNPGLSTFKKESVRYLVVVHVVL